MKSADIGNIKTAKHLNYLSLVTSGSTLICCALPATLVAIGSVATLTSLIAIFPQLIWMSEHKPFVFGFAGVILTVAGYLQWRSRLVPCPIDIQLVALCIKTRKRAFYVYISSLFIFFIGVFFAFIAPYLL